MYKNMKKNKTNKNGFSHSILSAYQWNFNAGRYSQEQKFTCEFFDLVASPSASKMVCFGL